MQEHHQTGQQGTHATAGAAGLYFALDLHTALGTSIVAGHVDVWGCLAG